MKFGVILVVLVVLFSCSDSENDKTEGNIPISENELLYKGATIEGGYLCYLKISPDNSVNFIYETDDNSVYGEYLGTIIAVNDTLYHVSCTLNFGQYLCKAFTDDSLEIGIKPSTLIEKESILVQYDNDELMSNPTKDKFGLSFPFDSELFNRHHPVLILTNRIHPVTNKPINIKIHHGSAAEFVSGDKLEFDIVLTKDSAYSVGERILQTGHLNLKLQ